MPIEMNSDKAICTKCGMAYGRRRGCFYVSYSALYKGTGYLPVCKDCVEKMFREYYAQCADVKMAVRQVCRKLDLYWNEDLCDMILNRSGAHSIIAQYISKSNSNAYAGKSYDDTLSNEGTLWSFSKSAYTKFTNEKSTKEDDAAVDEYEKKIPDDVKVFWGSGYTPAMYAELEQRRSYWMSRLPDGVDMDIGTEAIIRQICSLELDINRDRAAGRSVDKSVTALNTLLGSANLKPVQKKQDDTDVSLTNTPLGVWLYRYENKRPLPDVDEDLKDVNGIKRYIFTWMGHLCKMLGVKNTYSKMYEDEIARLRVEHPEYDGDDDETMMEDVLSQDGDSS